jgi:hypothetical protein
MTTIEANFWEFHAANPEVYVRLVSLARMLRGRGRKRCGMKMLFEQLRWEHYLETEDRSSFKLNNNYTSYYARLIRSQEPDLAGMFELRGLRNADELDVQAAA